VKLNHKTGSEIGSEQGVRLEDIILTVIYTIPLEGVAQGMVANRRCKNRGGKGDGVTTPSLPLP
jgi:hypothetical protein